MRIALVGPGRAGTAISLVLAAAGHDIAAVAARDRKRASEVASRMDAEAITIGEPIPPVDLAGRESGRHSAQSV